jgi:hypothetical protein
MPHEKPKSRRKPGFDGKGLFTLSCSCKFFHRSLSPGHWRGGRKCPARLGFQDAEPTVLNFVGFVIFGC